MDRIIIIGSSGAGKSTLSKRVAKRTGLPLVHLDQVYWQPGWQEPARESWRARHSALLTEPRWILEGTHLSTLEDRIQACDTIIYLDFPRPLCLFRACKRILGSLGRVRADMAPGCPERLDFAFLLYIWRFRSRYKPRVEAALARHGADKQLFHLTQSRDTEGLLKEF